MYNICTYIGLQKRDISVTYNICVSILKPDQKTTPKCDKYNANHAAIV